MTDRLEIAKEMMVELLANELRTPPTAIWKIGSDTAARLAGEAVCLADALIEASKVPPVPEKEGGVPPPSDPPVPGEVSQRAASPQAVEDAAAQIVTPGDLASPPSAPAGTNPVRPPSECSEECFAHHMYDFNPHAPPVLPPRRAKSPACGGLLCREDGKKEFHDGYTCPKYRPKRWSV